MKCATITLKLTKDHTVVKHNVTPAEVVVLVSDHHPNVKDNPIEVHKDTIKDTFKVVHKKVLKDFDGVKREVDVEEHIPDNRSDNEEALRLANKYGKKRVQQTFASIRTLPKDFEEAIKLGLNTTVETGLLGASVVAETKVI